MWKLLINVFSPRLFGTFGAKVGLRENEMHILNWLMCWRIKRNIYPIGFRKCYKVYLYTRCKQLVNIDLSVEIAKLDIYNATQIKLQSEL